MDFYSKLFLVNIIVMIAVLQFDRHVLGDAIEKTPVLGELCGLWAVISFCSFPIWLIYIIFNA